MSDKVTKLIFQFIAAALGIALGFATVGCSELISGSEKDFFYYCWIVFFKVFWDLMFWVGAMALPMIVVFFIFSILLLISGRLTMALRRNSDWEFGYIPLRYKGETCGRYIWFGPIRITIK